MVRCRLKKTARNPDLDHVPLPPIPPRKKLEYKKPRRLNAVSGVMALLFGGFVYFMVAIWPLLALRSSVKDTLADALPHLWKINLMAEGVARRELIGFKKKLLEDLRRTGVKDKQLELVLARNKKEVALQLRYAAVATFPGTTRTIQLKFSPRVETDAGRVDW
jgi:hypothetical protein